MGLKEVQKLYTRRGYFNRFYEIRLKYDSNKEAYEALEIEHENIFGRQRYSSYESFRTNKFKFERSILRKELASL